MNERYDSNKAIMSIINAKSSAPREKNIVGRLLSKAHNIHDHQLMSSMLATSAEKVVEPIVCEMYWTKGRRQFNILSLAQGSTKMGRVYQVMVMSDGTKRRKEVK